MKPAEITRRQALVGGAGLAGLGVAGALAGCGSEGSGTETSAATETTTSVLGGNGASTPFCVLTAEQEEGPFFLDLGQIRSAIDEGRPGVPMALAIAVVEATSCEPIADAAVDVWRCDALGDYSGVETDGTVGETYLRGIQLTGREGVAEFATIYPGHYEGRTTHIHLKVRLGGRAAGGSYSGGNVSYVGQLFTPDADDAEVFALSPYAESTNAVVPQSGDGIFTGQDGASSILTMTRLGDGIETGGFRAEVAVGVDPEATPS